VIQPPLIENQISGERSKIVDESLRKQKRNTGKSLRKQKIWNIIGMVMDTGILIIILKNGQNEKNNEKNNKHDYDHDLPPLPFVSTCTLDIDMYKN
jgi:hypothetical protein